MKMRLWNYLVDYKEKTTILLIIKKKKCNVLLKFETQHFVVFDSRLIFEN